MNGGLQMIASLLGKPVFRGVNRVTVDVRGVGYDVAVPLSTLSALPAEGEVFLHIYTVLRENALELYGFINPDEKSLFEMLLGVSGVGPRLALALISGISPEGFIQATLAGDLQRLTCIPGIGRKLAERIVLELKDKIQKFGIKSVAGTAPSAADSLEEDLVSSLINLGYKDLVAKKSAQKALKESPPGASLEQVLKISLKTLVK
jgi:holliday junction DNA helicase RuvA